MNWKNKIREYPKTLLLLIGAAVLAGAGILFISDLRWRLEANEQRTLAAIGRITDDGFIPRDLKRLAYEEFSPDHKKSIVSYRMTYHEALYRSYYGDYFRNKTVIAARDYEDPTRELEDVIFTGEERTGYPHWLGNEHVFFTRHCGTACEGLYLVLTGGKETWFAVLSYLDSKETGRWTHFRDWFDREFRFDGVVREMKSETVDRKTYLIFTRHDGEGNVLPEKRFLFTGRKLVEI